MHCQPYLAQSRYDKVLLTITKAAFLFSFWWYKLIVQNSTELLSTAYLSTAQHNAAQHTALYVKVRFVYVLAAVLSRFSVIVLVVVVAFRRFFRSYYKLLFPFCLFSYIVVHSVVFVSQMCVCVCVWCLNVPVEVTLNIHKDSILFRIDNFAERASQSLALSFSGLPNCRINYVLMAISKRWVLLFFFLLSNQVGWSVGRSLRYFFVAKCKCGAEAKKIIRPAIVVIVCLSTANWNGSKWNLQQFGWRRMYSVIFLWLKNDMST